MEALNDPEARLYVHCAAGVHRAPMMTLAILSAMEWEMEAAMVLIETRRPVVDFADVYVESVRRFLESLVEGGPRTSD
jgi:protein-tyrosine phosphatase